MFENRGHEIGVTLPPPARPDLRLPVRHAAHRGDAAPGAAARRSAATCSATCSTRRSRPAPGSCAGRALDRATCPAAARWPVEVRVVPHRHVPDLAALDDAERDELADVYADVLRRFGRFFPDVAAVPYIAAGTRHRSARTRPAAPAPAGVLDHAGAGQAQVPRRLGVGDGGLGQRHDAGAHRGAAAGAWAEGTATGTPRRASLAVAAGSAAIVPAVVRRRTRRHVGGARAGQPHRRARRLQRRPLPADRPAAAHVLRRAPAPRRRCSTSRPAHGHPPWAGAVDDLAPAPLDGWARYVAGAVWALRRDRVLTCPGSTSPSTATCRSAPGCPARPR